MDNLPLEIQLRLQYLFNTIDDIDDIVELREMLKASLLSMEYLRSMLQQEMRKGL